MRYRLLGVALGLVFSATAQAQTTLRWNLKAGEKLAVKIAQTTKSEVAYSGKKTSTTIMLGLELTWRVLTATEGKIALEQSIGRLSVDVDAPPAGRVQFDSAQADKPTGAAKEIAAALQPLLGTKVEIKMNERGEVLEARPLAGDGPSTAAADAAQTALFSKATIQQLLQQPLVVLPEKPVSKGEKWTVTSKLTTALGPAQQTTTYTYAGPLEQAGKALEKIESTSDLKVTPPAAATAAKLSLKSHEQSGTVLLDSAAGRLTSAEQNQKLVTERPYRETTIVVTLDSKQMTTVEPLPNAP